MPVSRHVLADDEGAGFRRMMYVPEMVPLRSNRKPLTVEQAGTMIDTENKFRARRRQMSSERGSVSSSYAYGRVGALTKLLKHRHGEACMTDDGEAWFEIVTPFLVEANALRTKDPHKAVAGWARRFLPVFVEQVGFAEISGRVDAALAKRGAAPLDDFGKWKDWLPRMDEIVGGLGVTWDEVTALKLRGFGSIVPPTAEQRREHNRRRMEVTRRKQQVRPRSTMTKTRDRQTAADCLGVNEKTLRRWEAADQMVEKIRQRIASGAVDVQNPCVSYLLGKDEMHALWTSEPAMNDDVEAARSA